MHIIGMFDTLLNDYWRICFVLFRNFPGEIKFFRSLSDQKETRDRESMMKSDLLSSVLLLYFLHYLLSR